MSFNDVTPGSSAPKKFKSFVTETEVEEIKKKRQEEWEKVRQPDQPLEAPEDEYDHRSLYEKLQEQKDKKQADFEEAHKLKNLIRGLDDDEVSFLELVDKTKLEMENRILKEELQELSEYRKAVANLSEEAAAARLQELKKSVIGDPQKKSRQQETLLKAVKRKSSSDATSPTDNKPTKIIKESDQRMKAGASSTEKPKFELQRIIQETLEKEFPTSTNEEAAAKKTEASWTDNNNKTGGVLRCIGVLPGMGVYTDSSESENSTGSDSEPELDMTYDLVGRPRRVVHSQHNA